MKLSLRQKITALVLVATLGYVLDRTWPREPTIERLERQLAGSRCDFTFESDRCAWRGFEPLAALLTTWHDCDLWAVQCLGGLPGSGAVAPLIEVLRTKTDIETCDGVLPIRTFAVSSLGRIGDRAAIEFAEAALAA